VTDQRVKALPGSVQENIETIVDLYARDESSVSGAQNFVERLSSMFSSTWYFGALLAFVATWIVLELAGQRVGIKSFDPSPFPLLQGVIALNGVLITIAVLVRQNRMTRMEEKRAHLNLQVTLLAEEKTTKIIQLLEELRGDMPNVKNRRDPVVEKLRVETDHVAVLDAIDAQATAKHLQSRTKK
jgi:uncharacterized membrane protein